MNLPEIQLEDDTRIYNFTLGKIYRKFKNGSIKETGCKDSRYYRISIEGKKLRVHRVLYEKYHGMKIPNDLVIDHIEIIEVITLFDLSNMIVRIHIHIIQFHIPSYC